jgi:hypothetical protein
MTTPLSFGATATMAVELADTGDRAEGPPLPRASANRSLHASHGQAAFSAGVVLLVFVKSGGRFSKNAAKASFASGERNRAANSSSSICAAVSTCSRADRFNSRVERRPQHDQLGRTDVTNQRGK